MNLDNIIDSWKTDTKLDDLNLDAESIKVSSLHAKYLGFLSEERILLRKLSIDRRNLVKKLIEYYRGDLNNPEDLKEIGREPYAKKVMKNEVMSYVEADSDLIKIDAKIEMQQEKVDTLLEIMKSINSRGFQIKNVIEWRRLTFGG